MDTPSVPTSSLPFLLDLIPSEDLTIANTLKKDAWTFFLGPCEIFSEKT